MSSVVFKNKIKMLTGRFLIVIIIIININNNSKNINNTIIIVLYCIWHAFQKACHVFIKPEFPYKSVHLKLDAVFN